MPAVSVSQRNLMGWAYACRNGNATNCPERIMKLGSSMSMDDLRKFAKTKHEGLPEKVEEGSSELRLPFVYLGIEDMSPMIQDSLLEWMKDVSITYTVIDRGILEVELPSDLALQESLRSWIDVLEMPGYVSEDLATMGSIVGMGPVTSPASTGTGVVGSGDLFPVLSYYVNGDEEDDDEYYRKKGLKKPTSFYRNRNMASDLSVRTDVSDV